MALGDRLFLLSSRPVPIRPLAQEGSWAIFRDQKAACGFTAAWVSLDESEGQILCFSPPGQCFQSDSKQGNVLLWGTGKGIIIFHHWARVSNLSQVGKNEWLGRWSIHSFNVWSAHLHVSNRNNLPALSCFTAVPASEVSEHTKGVKYCFWMY